MRPKVNNYSLSLHVPDFYPEAHMFVLNMNQVTNGRIIFETEKQHFP